MNGSPVKDPDAPQGQPQGWAALGALGIVFGDLATSPLYTLQTVAQATGGHFTAASALGSLSLIVWTLIITISIKYCLFVMRADNHGEGGILALMSLVGAITLRGRAGVLAFMGLVGAALLYGDGIITPAISVLSALEGVNVATDTFRAAVMPLALIILSVLFGVQRFGTARIGHAFGPIMALWCAAIATLGLSGIIRRPEVLWAIDPRYALQFLGHSGAGGLLVLGGAFLCITGGEALYADMGHFGKKAIRLAWYLMVLPALLLSYAGQTAILLEKGTIAGNPFFQLAPHWAIYPLVLLATAATIIASQAIITGSFSMTRQAVQLGWLPSVTIRQTSDRIYGQIYVPIVNWLMMAATLGVVVGFRSSDRLAGAYGTAVSTTMLLTSCLLFAAMRKVWRWSWLAALLISGVFLIVDASYFVANLLKIADGGWLPLTFGATMFAVMAIWRTGIDAVIASMGRRSKSPAAFLADLDANAIPRVPGTAVFLTKSVDQIPPLLIDNVKHMGALQRTIIALTVQFEETPRIAEDERFTVSQIGDGFWRVIIRFGFIEIPDLASALKRLTGLGDDIDLNEAVYFAPRGFVISEPKASIMARWSLPIFAFLYRNAVRSVDRFNLPAANVVEIAQQMEV